MINKRLCLILPVILLTLGLMVGPVGAQAPDQAGEESASTPAPPATSEPSVTPLPPPPENMPPPPTSEPPATPALELTTAGWLEVGALAPAGEVSPMAVTAVDCTTMSPPVVGFEISRGQDPTDIADFVNDLAVNGFSVGTIDISAGAIPPCVAVLIVQGSTRGFALASPYTAADGAVLRAWTSSGHGLMLSGEFGSFRAGAEALFQAYGYSQQGGVALSDPTDFDPPGPANSWVIYQADNFAGHPILSGVNGVELLASSSLAPTSNALVTSDADANPLLAPVAAAFNDGAGCVALFADSNWNSVVGAVAGYFKQDNARVARQAVAWLSGCGSLALTKLAAPNPVQAGGLLTYTLTAANNSATLLTNVLITDTTPPGTIFVSASAPFFGPDANGVVSWPLGALNPNSSASVTMLVQVDSATPLGAVITNTGWVTSSQGLTDTAATFTPVNTPMIDPLVTKGVNTNQAQVGQALTFTLTLSQAQSSNGNATNVQVVDALPPEVNLLGPPEVNAGFTQVAGQVVTWIIPVLAPADVRVMTMRAQVNAANPPPLTIFNQAVLHFDQGVDRLSNQVQVLVPAAAPTSTPLPTPTPTPSDQDDDDDDNRPPPPTPIPATPVAAVQPAATSVLPVVFLPETGRRAVGLFGPGWIGFSLALLLVAIVVAALFRK